MKKTLFTLIITLLFSVSAQAELKSLPEIEHALEEKIESKIKLFYGDIKVGVSVKLAEENRSPDSVENDVGYLPFTPGDQTALSEKIGVNLQIASSFPESQIAGLKELVLKSLAGYKVVFSISKIAIPDSSGSNRNPASVEESQSSSFLKEWAPHLAIPLGLLFASIILGLCFTTIARSLRSLSDSILSGLKSMEAEVSHPVSEVEVIETLQTKNVVADAQSEKRLDSNLDFVRRILDQRPSLFTKAWSQKKDDFAHFSTLLTYLSSEQCDQLNQLIRPDQLKRALHENASSEKGVFSIWLQDFCERLSSQRMAQPTLVEKSIQTEKLVSLFSTQSDQMIEILKQSSDPATWRVALELLPAQAVSKLLSAKDGLALALDASKVPQSALVHAADQLLKKVEAAKKSIDPIALEQKRFFEDSLFQPVIQILSQTQVKQWDTYLDEISTGSHHAFGNFVRERFWTPRSLVRVPDEYLKNVFSNLQLKAKAVLIHGLGEPVSTRLMGFLPSDSAREMVMDTVGPENRDFVMKFLALVQSHYEAGRFELLDKPEADEFERSAA